MTQALDKMQFQLFLLVLPLLIAGNMVRARDSGTGLHRTLGAVVRSELILAFPLSDSVILGKFLTLIPGILQARTLEWVAISFSTA